jgi:hypothetical protein
MPPQLGALLQSARGLLPALSAFINRRMTVFWVTCRRHRHSYGRFEEDTVWHSKQEGQQQDMTGQQQRQNQPEAQSAGKSS